MKSLIFLIVILFITNISQAQTPQELAAKNNDLDSTKIIQPENHHPRISATIARLLSRYHYRKTTLNDSVSSVIFDNYIKSLDNYKLYFLAEDIEMFEKQRYNLDDYIFNGNLDVPYEIFNRYKSRLTERIESVKAILDKGFDFTIDEEYVPDRSNSEWAKSKAELDELWRKRLKNDALNLILSGKEEDKVKETLEKRYFRFHKLILQYVSEDVFQLYMNALANAEDPHTNYFSPKTSEDFKIGMSLSLQGIGAQLRSIDDYTTIVRIIPGGPADKSGLLKEDDKIVGVGQGEEGEMIDVIGWRIDDVVHLIRGEKGTLVRLNIIPADADPSLPPEEIKIVRDEVLLEDQAAKSEIIEINENNINYKFGVIDIPTFYSDPRKKSLTKDVRLLLDSLKMENIDGLVIDLRNNGGGSLQEAVDLSGLFITQGPIVQIRNTNGAIENGSDTDPEIVYDGPLIVLINRYSASASEIFSAAIQDYGRGIIVGEQSYGKGTVQNLIPLERVVQMPNVELGEIKMTIAKFYRITGSSTQHLGVIPDIKFPSALKPEEYGESSKPSALKWDQISTSNFKAYDNLTDIIPTLIKNYEARIKTNPEFDFILEDIQDYKEKKKKKSFSLNIEVRKKERDIAKAKKEKREEQRSSETDLDALDNKEVHVKNLKVDDPFLDEAAHILVDFILLTTG